MFFSVFFVVPLLFFAQFLPSAIGKGNYKRGESANEKSD